MILRMTLLGALILLLAITPGTAQVGGLPKPAIRPPANSGRATPATSGTFTPKFEAVAETKLLMEGLALANYRSVHKLLKNKPADVDTWTFARGQAILLAETGNLLLLRPPRNSGRDTWMKHGMDLREKAATLARFAATRDYERSKQALDAVTTSCNRCHQTFRVPVKVAPEGNKEERDT